MGLNIIERIQAKIELFRLEQRYTRRRHRRSTFVSNAIYVDGEYIYNTPNTTGSSANSSSSSKSDHAVENSAPSSPVADADAKAQKRLNRWSSMPGFGSTSSSKPSTVPQDWRIGAAQVQ